MIKKLALGLLLVGITAVTQNARASRATILPDTPLTFVGNGYVVLDVNGGGDAFYNVNNASDTTNPLFDNDNSSPTAFTQTFTIQLGQSIRLGGELQTFPSVGGSSAFLGYAVMDLTETTATIPFAELNLPFLTNAGSNDVWQQLASTAGGVEIGSSLPVGSYLLVAYQHGSNGTDNTFTNEGGTPNNNWEAQINVVPEPATILLVGPALLGGMFFIRRRRA